MTETRDRPSPEVSAVLRKAAELIERDGWFQGNSCGDGRYCIATAIHEAAARERCEDWTTITRYMRAAIGEPLIDWNDAPERTAAEVCAALRAAAGEEAP